MAAALKNAARTKLRIAMIPADGIGREVLPVRHPPRSPLPTLHSEDILQAARHALEALGSSLPPLEFTHLDAGFEHFTKKGVALPEETLECVFSILSADGTC